MREPTAEQGVDCLFGCHSVGDFKEHRIQTKCDPMNRRWDCDFLSNFFAKEEGNIPRGLHDRTSVDSAAAA